MLLSEIVRAEAIRIEPVEPGLHIEKMGFMRKVDKHVEAIYTINLADTDENLEKLHKLREEILEKCRWNFIPSSDVKKCHTIDKISFQKLVEIQTKCDQLTTRRVKRGWFNGGGAGLRIVLGTLDDGDRQRIDKRLDELDKQQVEIGRVIREYGDLMQRTVESMNSAIPQCLANNSIFTIINKNFADIEHDMEIFHKQNSVDKIVAEMLYAFDFLTGEYSASLERIQDTLKDLENSVLSTKLVPITTILSDLNAMKLQTKDLELPLQGNFTMQEFAKFSRFGVARRGKNLLIIFVVPLVNIGRLPMYEVIAVPTIEESVARTIRVDDSIFITDEAHQSSFRWREEDTSKHCNQVRNEYICNGFITWNRKQNCELAVITGNDNKIDELCTQSLFALNSTLVIPMQSKNKILVLCKSPMKSTFIGESNKNLRLERASIVTVEERGKLFIGDDLMIDFPELENVVKESDYVIEPKVDFNFANFSFKADSDSLKLIPVIESKVLKHEELSELGIEWKKFNEKLEDNRADKLKEKIWTIVISVTTTLFGICLISYLSYRLWRTINSNPLDQGHENDIELEEVREPQIRQPRAHSCG